MKVGVSRRRIFTENGEAALDRINMNRRRRRFIYDYLTTLLDFHWSWIMILFTFTFVVSWLVFAGIWFGIMKAHGDFEPSDKLPCVLGVKTFVECLLFSIETQQTIGYGTRSVTRQCESGVILLIIQTCFGMVLQALWVGIIYTKLARPTKRRHTLIWSRQAVISLRDRYLTLQVRLGEIRHQSTLLEAHVRMYYISKRVTTEGEVIPLNMIDMNVGFDTGRDRLMLIWPQIIEHRIDAQSPLWLMDRQQLRNADFEILMVFEGIIESTGLLTRTKHSYTPDNIVWGARFEQMILNEGRPPLTVDYSKFHSIYWDKCTKPCSASQL